MKTIREDIPGAKPIKAWLGTKEVIKPGATAGLTSSYETIIDVEDAALQQTKNIAIAAPKPEAGRVGLTDEQIKPGVEALGGDLWNVVGAYFREGVRFAEKHHGIAVKADGER